VAVFFISGRPPTLREATGRNLREQAYGWTGVAEQGCTIVLALGDQESDLGGGYAERTFKLPNPVYYLR
jgi:hypothetical protein